MKRFYIVAGTPRLRATTTPHIPNEMPLPEVITGVTVRTMQASR